MTTPKTILITGANKGLGLGIAQVAAARDPSAHYILTSRNVEAGEKAIQDMKNSGIEASFELLQLDITNDDEIHKAAEYVTTKHGKLDVLINNAGIAKFPENMSSPSTIRTDLAELLSVNVTSVYCMCEAFRPLLDRSSQPKVINITSGLGSIANTLNAKVASLPLYGVSKVALNGLTAHLQAGENAKKDKSEGAKIRFYTVAPGVLNTTLVFVHNKGKDPAVGAEVVVQLLMSDNYPGGTQWEFKDDKMQEIPW